MYTDSTKAKIVLDPNGILTIDNTNIKKLKGYQFDSLVYRYIRAREQMAEYEFYKNKTKDKKSYYEQAHRDILRFCQILNEAIGEHE